MHHVLLLIFGSEVALAVTYVLIPATLSFLFVWLAAFLVSVLTLERFRRRVFRTVMVLGLGLAYTVQVHYARSSASNLRAAIQGGRYAVSVGASEVLVSVPGEAFDTTIFGRRIVMRRAGQEIHIARERVRAVTDALASEHLLSSMDSVRFLAMSSRNSNR